MRGWRKSVIGWWRRKGRRVGCEKCREDGGGGVRYERVEEEREKSVLRERLGRGGIWTGDLTI
jgi:hypothetical protein